MDTCSRATDFDTTLVALDAAGDRIVACGDDGCGLQSKIAFSAQVGDVFVLRVAGFRRATGMGLTLLQWRAEAVQHGQGHRDARWCITPRAFR